MPGQRPGMRSPVASDTVPKPAETTEHRKTILKIEHPDEGGAGGQIR
jgi:hypothetical protein